MIVLRGILKAEDDGTWRWKGVWAFGALPTTTTTTTTTTSAADDTATGGDQVDRDTSPLEGQTADTTESNKTTATSAVATTATAAAVTTTAAAATTTTTAAAAATTTTTTTTTTTPRGRPKSQQQVAISRPFDYTWEKPVLPSQVLIPSANPMPEESSKEDNNKEAKVKDTNENNNQKADEKCHDEEVDDDDKPLSMLMERRKEAAAGGGGAPTNEGKRDSDTNETQNDSEMKVVVVVSGLKETPTLTSVPPDHQNQTNTTNAMDVIVIDDEDGEKDDEDAANETKRDEPITYATARPSDPPFTDASLAHPDKCPLGGLWKGFFENLPKRRDKSPIQVPELFHLFFNATPPNDARITFANEGIGGDTKATNNNNNKQQQSQQQQGDGRLHPGHVHVRGCGTNEFGTFEIVGSLDLETGMLECQRMYVANPETSSSYRTPLRSSSDATNNSMATRTKSRTTNNTTTGGDSADLNRPYLTRKRQLSWKRRSSFDTESKDEDITNSGRKGSGPKKRVKLDEKAIVLPFLEATQAVSPLANAPLPDPNAVNRSKKPPSSPRLQQAKKKTIALVPNTKNASIPSLAETNRLKLPDAGDPRKARWRSAHFLYYQRHEPSSTTEEGGGNSKGSSSNPSYVVYEGEMQDSLRWGYGTCLYSNGMLYEGEWKRNKEHGKGTLMTGDRTRVIYEGEWERGRMHGKGVYYYGQADQINKKKDKKTRPQPEISSMESSRYEGEFKENMRHGVGTYYLPDGSIYSGMWREGLMSGRGVFTWPDNSVYDGDFRDGKRNGQGLLKTSDGFTYDGMWVQNAMEGRGSAIYPNGQRYDGLFSNGRREGRGTIRFTNGAVYEGRFRDDAMDGQGTMKISRAVVVPRSDEEQDGSSSGTGETKKDDFMIPVSFQSDMSHIHQKAGFNEGGE